MTIAHLDLHLDPITHGFRAVKDRNGWPLIVSGSDAAHGDRLAAYQAAVRQAADEWVDEHAGEWPHWDQAIALGALFWLRRPTTYRKAEVWHRTRKGGSTGRGGDLTTLLRSVEDGLTGVFYPDDGHVAAHHDAKILIDRDQAQHVELWVGPADSIARIVTLMQARMPVNQRNGQGALGQSRNPHSQLPVTSEEGEPERRTLGAYRDCQVPLPVPSSHLGSLLPPSVGGDV